MIAHSRGSHTKISGGDRFYDRKLQIVANFVKTG
jgi:hypothetical protein